MNESRHLMSGLNRHDSSVSIVIALLIYGFGAALSLAVRDMFNEDDWPILLHVAAMASIYFLWSRGKWGGSRFESYGAAILLSTLVFRLVAIIDTTIWGIQIDSWPPGINRDDPWWLMARGEAITQLSIIIVVSSWSLAIGGTSLRTGFIAPLGRKSNVALTAWVLYALAIAIETGRRIFELTYGSAETFLRVFYIGGVAATLLIANTRRGTRARIVWAAGLALPLSILAIGGGMKENILIPLIPTAALILTTARGWVARLGLLVAGILFVGLLQSFTTFARPILWSGAENVSIGRTIDEFQSEADPDSLSDGLRYALGRLNLTNSHAWTVAVVDGMGHDPEEVFGSALYVLIPRVVWPEKPLADPGGSHTRRVMGLRADQSMQTSTAAGFGGELYIGGGWTAVALGSLFLGLFIAGSQRFLARSRNGAALAIYNMSLFLTALRYDETHLVPWIAGSIALVLGLKLVVRALEFFVPEFSIQSGDDTLELRQTRP